ncbi:phosphotransferase [Rhodobacteraceae bacterium SC52]|nr:phosphotransferase [Rhodobacteraceae bacterium SC52]
MTDATLIRKAISAAQAWGTPDRAPRLVQQRENTVFDVTLDDGRRIALRFHRAGYQDASRIASELRWMESLADAGFPCPWPQRTRSGALTDDCIGVTTSAVQWLNGTPICSGKEELDAGLMHDLGALLADLHLTSDAVAPTDLARPDWRASAFCCGDAPIWGRFWENPTLSTDEVALLRAARDAAKIRLAALPVDHIGLIHADVLQENVLAFDGLLYLIDFDDGGVGYRLYDLATALIQSCDSPNMPELAGSLMRGYADAGGPLPKTAFMDLPMFVMLRALASAGWVIGRVQPDDPRMRGYADRACRLAREWLADQKRGSTSG